MIIYRILNTINGKGYIGQTIFSAKERWLQHCKAKTGCRYLINALNKYGKDKFIFETLDSFDTLEELNRAEKYYISFYNTLVPNGYYLKTGGNNGGQHHQETKNKISVKAKLRPFRRGKDHPMFGKRHSEESNTNMSRSRFAKKQTKETKLKRSIRFLGNKNPRFGQPGTFTGRKHTQETKDKISKTKKEKNSGFRKSILY